MLHNSNNDIFIPYSTQFLVILVKKKNKTSADLLARIKQLSLNQLLQEILSSKLNVRPTSAENDSLHNIKYYNISIYKPKWK